MEWMRLHGDERVQHPRLERDGDALVRSRPPWVEYVADRVVDVVAVIVGHVDPADAGLDRLKDDRRAHRAGADDQHARPFEPDQLGDATSPLSGRQRLGPHRSDDPALTISPELHEEKEPAATALTAVGPLLDERYPDPSLHLRAPALTRQHTPQPSEHARRGRL